jgi:phosphoribosylanthranilate isomerase
MTFVKICGITNVDDALCALDAGADLLGFIFYPPSPRSVSVEAATQIVNEVRRRLIADGRRLVVGHPSSVVTCVGVFVKEAPAHVLRVLHDAGLDAAQLHGNSEEDLIAMDGRAYLAVKDWRVKSGESDLFHAPLSSPHAPLPDLLLDANHPTLWGGSGQRADASLAAQIAKQQRLLLAGGLTPDNVADAIRAVKPWGVDVASGTEATPGIKDHAKVRAFVANAKRAGKS